jgi:glycosyltransferase involved in cell wall biosynthesis
VVNEPTDLPLLSIVVPVHRVEEYLHRCLDSVLDGLSPAEAETVELIGVDDASPDRCGEMLDAYAATHPEVRTLHLTNNVGLGLARNAGLEVATGRYVWFVDSDDWLPPGTVPAVLERLREHQPDVLIVDHLRAHEDGRLEVDASSHLLRGVPAVVRLADRPELLRVQHTAWNKIVRRDFLDELELRFFPGWYEDVPFSHPLLIGAEKISVLDRVCYFYRQGRAGAITSTRSDRHFDAFAQYDRMLAWVDRRDPGDQLRAEVFALMVNHFLVVVGNDGRLLPHLRRDFFRRAAEHYRRHLPAGGYPRPGGVAGLKHRLMGRDSYLAYSALRTAHRLSGRLRRPAATPESTSSIVAPAPCPAPAGQEATAQPDPLAGPGAR